MVLVLKQNGRITLKDNKVEYYDTVYALEHTDVFYIISIESITLLKKYYSDFDIDKVILPETKKFFWKTILKSTRTMLFLESKIKCGSFHYQGDTYYITAKRSGDYVTEDNTLIMGAVYTISIDYVNHKLNLGEKLTKWDLDDNSSTTNQILKRLLDYYYEWCKRKQLEQLDMSIIKQFSGKFISTYFEKDLIQFISNIFDNEQLATDFYEYVNTQYISYSNTVDEQLSALVLNLSYCTKLIFNESTNEYELKTSFKSDLLLQIKQFIHENIPTIGLCINYSELFKSKFGSYLFIEDINEVVTTEYYFINTYLMYSDESKYLRDY